MDVLIDGKTGDPSYLFAHGAGGAMDTPFMTTVAASLAAAGIRVVRFEFPYMAARRTGKKTGAPDRPAVLLETWRNAILEHGGKGRVFVGGKSMGGRIATMVADEMDVAGAVCFGYPFHPPGKPEQLRTAHLETLRRPLLILQGERDPFGSREEVERYILSPAVTIHWIADGDHSLAPRRSSGRTPSRNLEEAVAAAVSFMAPRA